MQHEREKWKIHTQLWCKNTLQMLRHSVENNTQGRRRAYWRNRPEGLSQSPTTGCCDLGSDIQTPQIRKNRYQLSAHQLLNKGFRVALWPRLYVAGILVRRYGFDRRSVLVRFVADSHSGSFWSTSVFSFQYDYSSTPYSFFNHPTQMLHNFLFESVVKTLKK